MLAPNSPLLDNLHRRNRRLYENAIINPIRVYGDKSSIVYKFFLVNIILISVASLALFILHGRKFLFQDYAYGFYYLVIIILALIYKRVWIPCLLVLSSCCGCSSIYKARNSPCIYKWFNYVFWGSIGNPIVSFFPMFIWSYYIYDAILEDKAVAVKYEVAIIAIESWMCLLVIIGGLLIYYRIPIDTNFVINYVTHSQQRRSILSPHNQQQFLGTNNTINNNDLLLATGSDTDSNNGSQNAIGSGVNTVNSVNTLNTMNLNRIDNGYGNSADNNSLTSVNSQVSEIESQIRVFRRSVLGVQFNNNNNNNNFNFNISNNNNITSNINSGRNIVGNEKLENDKPSVLNNTFGSLAIPSVNQLNDRSVSEDIVIADQLNVNSTHGEVVAGPTAAKETLGAVQVSESRKFQQVHRTESKQFLGDWFSLTKSLVVMLNQNDDECIICYETYKPDDIMAELVCKHQFHRDCVTDWLLNNPTCPYCRTRVLKANF